jgi:hypothetical protein
MDPDFELIAKVRQIHADTRGSYGSRRMSGQLRNDGYDSETAGGKVMRQPGRRLAG